MVLLLCCAVDLENLPQKLVGTGVLTIVCQNEVTTSNFHNITESFYITTDKAMT